MNGRASLAIRVTFAAGLALAAAPAGAASSFDRWLRNPYPVAAGFSFPVGDGEGGGTYKDAAGNQHDGWYVATHLGDEYALAAPARSAGVRRPEKTDSRTPRLWRGATGIHTGEDWNGRGGGDTDFGQPVMAIATGKVVVAQRFANPWGQVVMIEHIVLDGPDKRRVRSQYAHLSRIDVREGQVVHARDVIGAVGKDPDGAYPAHLHLELRSDLTLGPTYWPSDHGRDAAWIRKHYLDPSAFIRAHRKLPDPAAERQIVLVDQARFRMQVRVGGRVARELEIGLGQAAGQKRREGDLRTPKGIYFVVDKQKGSFGGEWGDYFGGYWIKMNYPGPADAAWGVDNGVIDDAGAAAIVSAWSERKLTPQNTPLGSGIGFHGWASDWQGGRSGARLSFGCVVLHNRDIASWFDEVSLGTMVVIF